MLKSKKIGEK